MAAGIPNGKMKPLEIANNDIGIINWSALEIYFNNGMINNNTAPDRKNKHPIVNDTSIP